MLNIITGTMMRSSWGPRSQLTPPPSQLTPPPPRVKGSGGGGAQSDEVPTTIDDIGEVITGVVSKVSLQHDTWCTHY